MIDMKLDSLGFACVAAVPQIESLRSDNQKLRASVGPSGRAAMADTSLLFSLEQVGAVRRKSASHCGKCTPVLQQQQALLLLLAEQGAGKLLRLAC